MAAQRPKLVLSIAQLTVKGKAMQTIRDFLAFRSMASPVLLQVLFWGAIGGTFYGTYVLITLGHWAWWMALVFGTLLVRVLFERALIAFRTYDRLTEIAEALRVRSELAQ